MAMSSASNKTMKLEKSKQVERLNENTDRLRALVNTGKTLENEHAQEVCPRQQLASYKPNLCMII